MIPLTAKLGYTLWVALWVPLILTTYGPQNFFWLCNIAQLILLYAIWRENRLLLASQSGMFFLVGSGWTLDLVVAMALGGYSVTGFTTYMFNPDISLVVRLSSLYHTALPPFLLWLAWRVGHDRRGPWLQCLIGAAGVIGGWLFTDPERNINWVYEFFGLAALVDSTELWVACLLVIYPLTLFFPGDWLFRRFLRWLG